MSPTATSDTYDVVYIPVGASAFGGAERSLLDLAVEIRASGKRVLILAEEALKETPFAEIAVQAGLTVRWTQWAPEYGYLRNALAIWRVFRHLDASIVHFNISWRRGMWLVPLLARITQCGRLVGSMRAMPDPANRLPRKLHFGFIPGLRLWYVPDLIRGRVWARTLHHTVSVNRDAYPTRLVDEFGFNRSRLTVIYNGVRLPEEIPSNRDRARIREEYGFKSDDFIICYLGRLAKPKGIDVLVRAVARMSPSSRLWIIGDGPESQFLHDLAIELGLEERIVFQGFVTDPLPLLSSVDVCAVPSTWEEAFGRVVAEALALEVPVVVSRVGGMPELLDDGVHGRIVTPGDVDALLNALTELQQEPERREDMGRRGRLLALERYSMARVASQYNDLYTRSLAS